MSETKKKKSNRNYCEDLKILILNGTNTKKKIWSLILILLPTGIGIYMQFWAKLILQVLSGGKISQNLKQTHKTH